MAAKKKQKFFVIYQSKDTEYSHEVHVKDFEDRADLNAFVSEMAKENEIRIIQGREFKVRVDYAIEELIKEES